MRKPFTQGETATIWEDHQAGVPLKRIARRLGPETSAISEYVGRTGAIRPRQAAPRCPIPSPEADRFRINRPDPRRRLAFEGGPHVCPGASLARLEARIAVEEMLDNVASMTPPNRAGMSRSTWPGPTAKSTRGGTRYRGAGLTLTFGKKVFEWHR